jgi:hypothetical protein
MTFVGTFVFKKSNVAALSGPLVFKFLCHPLPPSEFAVAPTRPASLFELRRTTSPLTGEMNVGRMARLAVEAMREVCASDRGRVKARSYQSDGRLISGALGLRSSRSTARRVSLRSAGVIRVSRSLVRRSGQLQRAVPPSPPRGRRSLVCESSDQVREVNFWRAVPKLDALPGDEVSRRVGAGGSNSGRLAA